MTRVSTFGPSPDTLLPDDLNYIQDDYERLYSNNFRLLNVCMTDFQTRTTEVAIGGQPTAVQYLLGPDTEAASNFVPDAVTVYGHSSPGILGQDPNIYTGFGDIHPSSLLYWDPAEWTPYAGGRTLKWVLSSTAIFGVGGGTNVNTETRISVRTMQEDTDWQKGREYPETICAPWEGPPGHVSVIHPPIQPASASENLDRQVFEVDAPTDPGWYGIFLDYTFGQANPAPGGIGHIFANLSLRFSTKYTTVPAPIFIGSGTKSSSINSNTVTVTTGQIANVGDTILVSVNARSADLNLVSVTDSVGNFYVIDHKAASPDSTRSTFIARSVVKTTASIGTVITATFDKSRSESKTIIAAKVIGVALTPAGSGESMVAASTTFATSEVAAVEDNMLLFGSIVTSSACTITCANNPGQYHVYNLDFTAPITGGSWTFWLDGVQSSPIAYNGVTPAQMTTDAQAALNAMSNVQAGDIVVTGVGSMQIQHIGRFDKRNRTMSITDSTTGAGQVDFGVGTQSKPDGSRLTQTMEVGFETMDSEIAYQQLARRGTYRFDGTLSISTGYSAAAVAYRGPEA